MNNNKRFKIKKVDGSWSITDEGLHLVKRSTFAAAIAFLQWYAPDAFR